MTEREYKIGDAFVTFHDLCWLLEAGVINELELRGAIGLGNYHDQRAVDADERWRQMMERDLADEARMRG